jgi:thioredoxin reductase (NADPH)
LHIGPLEALPTADSPGSGGIERVSIQLSDLRIEERQVVVSSSTGERSFDAVYLALGCSSQQDLARSLGASCDEHGALMVNAHQETSVPGLYAAGDVVRGLNQVVVAAAESAIAATDIHNKLRSTRRHDEQTDIGRYREEAQGHRCRDAIDLYPERKHFRSPDEQQRRC